MDNVLIDLTAGSSDVVGMKEPYKHDKKFWSNPKHKRSMISCEPRVKQWAKEFLDSMKQSKILFEGSLSFPDNIFEFLW